MTDPRTQAITRLLRDRAANRSGSADALYEAVYPELVRVAKRQLQKQRARGKPLTLEPAELVHESFLNVVGKEPEFANSRHYYSFMTTVILRALLDYQRAGEAAKRGGRAIQLTLSGVPAPAKGPETPVADVARLLDELQALDSRKAEVIQMRFFWGLEMREVARLLGVSTRTAERDWRFARAWFGAQLEAG